MRKIVLFISFLVSLISFAGEVTEEQMKEAAATALAAIQGNDVEVNKENFPDDNFRNWILNNIDAAKDGVLTTSELESIDNIDCSNNQIKDLKGIEFFTNIYMLECGLNSLTSLDVSKNVNLIYLICTYNDLYSIDLSKNTKLEFLECRENRLTSLDLSKNTALQSIDCSINQLTSLDLSKNTNLQSVECYANQLTSLDVSMLQSLNSLNCGTNPLKNLDISKNSALKTLSCAGNQLTSLDLSNNSALEELQCFANQLSSLDISNKTKLRLLICENNQLTNLDVSNNTELSLLNCGGNPLASIDLSKNTKITTLYCHENSLTSLDLSNNTSLDFLFCINNQLTSLDVSKNTALTHLECRINQLTSIDVSMLKNLESLLVSENQLTSLDVSNNPSLHLLFCNDNHLKLLNVSKNTELTNLVCNCNLLTSLDISKNTNIERLSVLGNFLTSLDLSKNTKLWELRCEINQLYSLDLSNNNSLSNVVVSKQYPSMLNCTFDGLNVKIDQACLKVLNLSEGLAIPVPSSFDISKVSNLQLDGNGITGSVTTINGLNFLILSRIDGKRLSYSYDTNNNVAGLMKVDVSLEYTGNSHIWTDPETGLTWNYTISGDNAIIDQNAWATGDIVIPSTINGYTVSRIDFNAFSSSELTCLTIPSTVTSMCDFVLRGCINLEKLIVMAETPPSITDYTFVDYDVPLYVPDEAVSTYQNTNIWKRFTSIRPLSTVNQHSLVYMIDGEVYKTYTHNIGDAITPEPAPTKEGYTFSGWSKIPETMPAHDVTVTGTFSVNKYKLTYMVDDADYKTYEVEFGATITPEPEPTKEGYTFSGWSEIPETMPAHDVTVTGTFEKAFIPGDVNDDGLVNVTDIVATVNYIMEKPSDNFNEAAADLNGDGEVNVTDIVMMVSIIMNGDGGSSRRAAATSSHLVINRNNIQLRNADAYTAAQFDINLSDGQSINNVVLNVSSDHSLYWKMVDANTYRVVVYSMTNAAFRTNSDNLFTVFMTGSQNATISNELLIKADGTTGIDAIRKEAEDGKVYDLNGRQVKNPRKGVYIINGRKVVVK